MGVKITKKMRKKDKGMNSVTLIHFEEGYSPPVYHNFASAGQLPDFRKVAKGVPYVNPQNFN